MQPDENQLLPPQPVPAVSQPTAEGIAQTQQLQPQSAQQLEPVQPPSNTAQSSEAINQQPQQSIPNEEIIDPSIPEGNHQLLVIKRHPFGLVAMYLSATVGLVAAFGLLFFLVPSVLTGDTQATAIRYLMMFAVVATGVVFIVLLIATYVYRQNRWVVTDESVHQTSQRGLFNRQSSELSMANIEDVTAEQKGILAELFGFGTLRAETAGELPYFHFNYCPTPDKYAKIILDARQKYINDDPAQAKRANDLINAPGVRRA